MTTQDKEFFGRNPKSFPLWFSCSIARLNTGIADVTYLTGALSPGSQLYPPRVINEIIAPYQYSHHALRRNAMSTSTNNV